MSRKLLHATKLGHVQLVFTIHYRVIADKQTRNSKDTLHLTKKQSKYTKTRGTEAMALKVLAQRTVM